MDAMIEVEGLTQTFGRFRALDDISFVIPSGQVTAFLGPNGAGKSTTMRILAGVDAPRSGTVRVAGCELPQRRLDAAERIGYLPEHGPLYDEMTPRGLLTYLATARGLTGQTRRKRIAHVIDRCDLTSVDRKPIAKLSKGFRQRVGLAQALLHDPPVLLLDEPTSGLDPNQRYEARQFLKQLGEEKTILLSTHIMPEVDAVASRVLMLSRGRLVLDASVAEFGASPQEMEQAFRRLSGADGSGVNRGVA